MVAEFFDLAATVFHRDPISANADAVEFNLEDATAHFLTQTDTGIAQDRLGPSFDIAVTGSTFSGQAKGVNKVTRRRVAFGNKLVQPIEQRHLRRTERILRRQPEKQSSTDNQRQQRDMKKAPPTHDMILHR